MPEHFDLTSMFLLGLLGTGHCIGMCGPLVLAIPAQAGRLTGHLLYHLGRTTTYVGVGALLGGLGVGLASLASREGADPVASIARLQVAFSALAALFLLVLGLARIRVIREPGWMATPSPGAMPGFRQVLRGATDQGRPGSIFLFGLMLGFLPCGLSFAAFARALPAGGMLPGAALLLAFALGTWPGLLVIGTAASKLARRHRELSEILSGLLMIGMAVSLAADAIQALL